MAADEVREVAGETCGKEEKRRGEEREREGEREREREKERRGGEERESKPPGVATGSRGGETAPRSLSPPPLFPPLLPQ
eukprot:scaffold22894_cov26-Tisochrysis_lutea.AAC.3